VFESIYLYIFIGIIIIAGIIFFFFRRRRSDPLPERDPSCIWHSVVTKVEKVYDGDTIFAHIKGHEPIDKKPVGIRFFGIDTPEMDDERPAIKKKAQAARDFVEAEIKNARKIHLYNISTKDKYGRLLATVFCDRKDLAKMLLEKKLAKRYDGGKKAKW